MSEPQETLATTAPPPRAVSGRQRALVLLADRWILRLARHWLILFSLVAAIYAGLPFLAPTLMRLGYEQAGRAIYTLYIPNCHQLPERSFFLFGERLSYSLEELPPAGQGAEGARRHFVGDATLGYKMAYCERDTSIYTTILLAGLAFGLLRRWVRPLPFRYFLILCFPMLVDGGAQLLGLWESTWSNRIITGALFGLALVWVAYPHVQAAMDELRVGLEAKLARAAEDEAKP